MFSVRLVLADHYMSPPIPELDVGYSEFRGTEVKQVPVIRVFGSTITGKKTCLHIHGVFPYMYIPYEGSGAHDRLMYQIASSLDKALNISLGKANSTLQHVFKMTIVSGLPFYGFHTKEHQYFKIYFYNPLMVKKAAELLQSGAILNKMYQPHEAHVPYILQFMIDYNLYGMSHVHLKNVKFRRDPENPGRFECLSEEILLPERVTRISTCETEVDAMAADIINRTAVSDELALNPGLAAIWEDEKQRRREGGRTSQITPQPTQERPFAASTDSAVFFKQKLHEKLLLLNSQLSNNSSSLLDTPEVTRTPYPAETPEDSELLEASFLDLHVQSSGCSSFIRSAQMEQDNVSVVDEDLVLSLISSQRGTTHSSVLMDSQDIELAEVLHNLENSTDVDEDSLLGSQICQELHDETIHGCDDEDIQDFSRPLHAVVDCYTNDCYQKGNVNRYLLSALKVKSHICLVSDVFVHSNSQWPCQYNEFQVYEALGLSVC